MTLHLQNGAEFKGKSFGWDGSCEGEAVFSTAMVGYPESLTDPSYCGQILCLTYPLVGNYGVPSDKIEGGISAKLESEKIWVKGVVISDYSECYSHFDAVKSLGEWLKENRIPGICGVDTRAITTILREQGSMPACLVPDGGNAPEILEDPNKTNLTRIVSCKAPITYGSGKKKVVLIDCGVKHNILRNFLKRDVQVIRVPWDFDFTSMDYDGLFISNGPGDPTFCVPAVGNIKKAMQTNKPIFGICMGNLLLAKAAGAETFKLKYGHRGYNQPVQLIGTDKCYVTSQNHGFAVKTDTLPKGWKPLFKNLNDGTNEGLRHEDKPWFSVQFHPEASGGPTDTAWLFDKFVDTL